MIEPTDRTGEAPAPLYWNHRVGVHLVADLGECTLESFAPNEAAVGRIRAELSAVLAAQHFTELGSYYHYFAPGAVTATICLAESHLSFHSWPEERYVSFDLFACAAAYAHDPGKQAALARCEERVRSVPRELSSSMFHPGSVTIQALYR